MTRAVHLDMVTDLTAVTFIRCLKRFAGRRSLPQMFVSDNGKTFKPAATFVNYVFQDTTVKEHLAGQGSEWKFNLEKAPWWGGAFERLIKSTKRCLRKMIGRSRLSLDKLQTLLVEVESILNSRPISYMSAGDIEEPLTPSHLLTERRILSLPDNLTTMADPDDSEFNTVLSSTELETRLKRLSESLNYFWSRWQDEYLAELRESHRLNHRNSASHPSISKGDIVVIHDEDTPRGFWKVGRVEEVFVGRDGHIRGASVRLSSGCGVLRRPVQRLYPLVLSTEYTTDDHVGDKISPEMQPCDSEHTPLEPQDSNSIDNEQTENTTPSSRPRREAAVRAQD